MDMLTASVSKSCMNISNVQYAHFDNLCIFVIDVKGVHRKSARASLSTESMMQAAEAMKAGKMNLFRASKEFGVSR